MGDPSPQAESSPSPLRWVLGVRGASEGVGVPGAVEGWVWGSPVSPRRRCRLESRLSTDISSIVHLLQRQVLVPPAYSAVTSPHQPPPGPLPPTLPITPIRPLAQVRDRGAPALGVFHSLWFGGHPRAPHTGPCLLWGCPLSDSVVWGLPLSPLEWGSRPPVPILVSPSPSVHGGHPLGVPVVGGGTQIPRCWVAVPPHTPTPPVPQVPRPPRAPDPPDVVLLLEPPPPRRRSLPGALPPPAGTPPGTPPLQRHCSDPGS